MQNLTTHEDPNVIPENDLTPSDPAPAPTPPTHQNLAESTTFQNQSPVTNLHATTPPQPPPNLKQLLARELNAAQLAAIPLLVAGKSDSAVALAIGKNRQTINRWRLYDPLFISRLNRARAANWANTLDSLRHSLPAAVKVLTRALKSDNPISQQRAALMLLKLAGTSRLAPRLGPDSPIDVLCDIVERRRARSLSKQDLADNGPADDLELAKHYNSLLTHIESPACPDLPPPIP